MNRTLMLLAVCAVAYGGPKPNDLETYIAALEKTPLATTLAGPTPGSLYAPNAPLGALGLDLRARGLNDLITVLVQERASAVSRGTVKSSRSSNLNSSVGSIYGQSLKGLGALAQLSTSSDLDGEGTTSRESTLNTTVTARVVHVLSNGDLVIEGRKNVAVNSEIQMITLRGVVRPVDVASANTVLSERIGSLEVLVNGKGVVGDAIRRPFFLYRLLLGILPF